MQRLTGRRGRQADCGAAPWALPLLLVVLAFTGCGGGEKNASSPCPTNGDKVSFPLLDKSKRSPQEEKRLRILENALDSLPTAERHEDQEAMDLIQRAAALIKKQAPHKR